MSEFGNRALMKNVTAPGVEDESINIRMETHEIGGGWDPVILHWHNYCEFEFVLSGTGIHTLNNVPLSIGRGSAYLCMMEDFHKIKNSPDSIMKMINVKFQESLIQRPLLEQLYLIDHHRYCDFDSDEEIAQMTSLLGVLLQTLENKQWDQSIRKILVECTLNQILSLFLLHCVADESESAPISKEKQRIQLAISHIHKNFNKNISQEDVAKSAGLSANYFSALFKEQMGCSYSAYLLNLRLKYARSLIESEHITKVSSIASMVGFSSISYFIKAFKNKYEITPKEMIEKAKKK